MTTESIGTISRLRSQLTTIDRDAERAFERAFDLQQAGAAAEQVEAAMRETGRLQERARQLRERLGGQPALH